MGKSLRGFGANRDGGPVEGTAVVADNLQDATERLLGIPESDPVILVTREMPPSWSGLLRRVQGVVATTGSSLSSIVSVARELGLPVVVGLSRATRIITDGQRICVDAERGIVSLSD